MYKWEVRMGTSLTIKDIVPLKTFHLRYVGLADENHIYLVTYAEKKYFYQSSSDKRLKDGTFYKNEEGNLVFVDENKIFFEENWVLVG